jgi:holo-[acyl-carrier protein] synthase
MRIGIDLLDMARFARIAAHPAGRRLVFTAAELVRADALGEQRRNEYLAGRFCAKEAVAKALGRGLGQGLVWHDIEVVGDANGAPVVTVRGGALAVATRERIERIQVSLSHQGGLVVCVAVAIPGY